MRDLLKISIITPSSIQGWFIEDAIQSELMEDYPKWLIYSIHISLKR